MPAVKGRDGKIANRVVWFAVLQRAQRTDDANLAARARRQLERLGVDVQFRDGKDEKRQDGGTPDRRPGGRGVRS
jgi:hypothetical protein